MKSQPFSEYPWQFVSQDLCALESNTYLVTTDHYSDFIEVDVLENTWDLSQRLVPKIQTGLNLWDQL